MRLTKAERKYLEFLFTRDIHGDSPLPKGVGLATIRSCEEKKLVRVGANGYYPTALGRFVAEPLEWRAVHGWAAGGKRADFLGGTAWLRPAGGGESKRGSAAHVWFAIVRGEWSPSYQDTDTQAAARDACEAWVDAERLRVAGDGE